MSSAFISWPSGFAIRTIKLTKYLLNPAGNDPSKAKFFLGHGFRAAQPQELAIALSAHTNMRFFVGIKIAPRGHKLLFEGPIYTPNATIPMIRAVWFVVHAGNGEAEFVTAYPCP